MFNITKNLENGNYEFVNGRVRGSVPMAAAHPAFSLAFEAAQRFPETASRAWKAAQLVAAGAVTMTDKKSGGRYGQTLARVKSQSSNQTYFIGELVFQEADLAAPQMHRNHKFYCTCYDYREHNAPAVNGQPACKHIIAASMVDRLSEGETVNEPPALDTAAFVEARLAREKREAEIAAAACTARPDVQDEMAAGKERARRRRRAAAFKELERQAELKRLRMEGKIRHGEVGLGMASW